MSAVTITDWARAGADDDSPDAPCETCATLRADLAKAHALLRTIRRLDSKPAKRETLEDDPATLEAVGHAVYCASIRARIDLYLAGRG